MPDSYVWIGRQKKPLWKKLTGFCWWWWMNDDNQTVDQATWYHPEWSYRRRWWTWNVWRNPLQNLRSFVLGVQDRNYTVTGKYPVNVIQRDDMQPPEMGWQWCVCWTLLPRPFASYSGEKWVLQFGWQFNGFFAGIKFNRHQ